MRYLRFYTYMFLLQFVFVLASQAQQQNQLTKKEKDAGWHLLFDGSTFNGWKMLNGSGWIIKDGALTAVSSPAHTQSDIITTDQFEDFELVFEFKVYKNTNSGVKYLVTNDFPQQRGAFLGLEYQILDEANFVYPERGNLRTTASLYDLIPANPVKQVLLKERWNTAKIQVKGKLIRHWLNGKQVVSYDRSTAAFAQLVRDSKYKELSNFGQIKKGYFLLQNEGSPVSFRNIKVRQIN